MTVTGQGDNPISLPLQSLLQVVLEWVLGTHVIIAMQKNIRFSEESVQPLRRQCGTCDPALGRIDPRVGDGGEDHWK